MGLSAASERCGVSPASTQVVATGVLRAVRTMSNWEFLETATSSARDDQGLPPFEGGYSPTSRAPVLSRSTRLSLNRAALKSPTETTGPSIPRACQGTLLGSSLRKR